MQAALRNPPPRCYGRTEGKYWRLRGSMFSEKLLEASVLKDKEKPACKEEDREVEEGRHSRQTIEERCNCKGTQQPNRPDRR